MNLIDFQISKKKTGLLEDGEKQFINTNNHEENERKEIINLCLLSNPLVLIYVNLPDLLFRKRRINPANAKYESVTKSSIVRQRRSYRKNR